MNVRTANDGIMASFEEFFQSLDDLCGAPGVGVTTARKAWMRDKGQELKHALLRYQAVMDILVEGILVRDKDGILQVYNAAAEKLLGIPLKRCLGKASLGKLDLISTDGSALEASGLPAYECLGTGRPKVGFVFGVVAKDGIRWLETNSLPILRDRLREPVGVVSSFWNVTERKNLLDRLMSEATHDPLTALPNRRALDAKLGRVLESATRAYRPFSLCLCDFDHFKAVNDHLGHKAGDAVLCRFADLLKTALRGNDFPARIGGDEFAILFEGTPAAQACSILERIRRQFSFKPCRGLEPVTGTFGIADWSPGMSSGDLMKAADEALYVAKGQGRNRIQVGTGEAHPARGSGQDPG
jgi:diguanylate cyclase (GGDEF)-like protein